MFTIDKKKMNVPEIDGDLLNLLFEDYVLEEQGDNLNLNAGNFELGELKELVPEMDEDGMVTLTAAEGRPASIPSASNRFASNENIDMFLQENQNANTLKKTKQDVDLLHLYLQGRGEMRNIQFIPPEQLSEHVSQFLVTVRKKNGEQYEPCSLRSFLSSFDRHLKASGYKCSIINSIEFAKCREVLRCKQKQLKSMGKGNKPQTADPINDEVIEQFYSCGTLGNGHPEALLHSLWLICTQHFGMRTGQEVRNLKWGDVQLKEDGHGKYLVYDTERQTKTRTGANYRDTR